MKGEIKIAAITKNYHEINKNLKAILILRIPTPRINRSLSVYNRKYKTKLYILFKHISKNK